MEIPWLADSGSVCLVATLWPVEGQDDGAGHGRVDDAVLVDETRLQQQRRKRLKVNLCVQRIELKGGRKDWTSERCDTWMNLSRANSRRSVRL